MKTLAKAAAGIAFVAVLALVIFHFTTILRCTVTASVEPASANEERFDAFREQMTSGAFYGYVYETGVLGAASDYYFVTLNVNIKNPGLFPAEWVLLTPIRNSGDAACEISCAGPADLQGGAETQASVTYLTTRPEAVTKCGIEYYVFGKLQSDVISIEQPK